MAPKIVAGWKRFQAEHGIVLTMQLAETADNVRTRKFQESDLVLNDRQLRSLARDLARACEERGVQVFAPRPRWKIWA